MKTDYKHVLTSVDDEYARQKHSNQPGGMWLAFLAGAVWATVIFMGYLQF